MPTDLKQQLAQARARFEAQNAEFESARQTLRSLDPSTVLSIREEWLSQLSEVTQPRRRAACIHPMALRA